MINSRKSNSNNFQYPFEVLFLYCADLLILDVLERFYILHDVFSQCVYLLRNIELLSFSLLYYNKCP